MKHLDHWNSLYKTAKKKNLNSLKVIKILYTVWTTDTFLFL